MKIIEFRGKRIDNNEWVYGSPYIIKEEEKAFIVNNCQSLRLTTEDSTFTGCEVKTLTVGQYSGIDDKNGRMVFEDDVILYDGIHGIVLFEDGMFMVKFNYTRGIHVLSELDREIKVIGNIHDNTNLNL